MAKRGTPQKKRASMRYFKNIEQFLAILLVLGYAELGVVNVENGALSFTLRGPTLQRLTSGNAPQLKPPGTGLFAQSYLRIEALIAYLLLIGEANIEMPGISSSVTVWGVTSKWFQFSVLQSLIKDTNSSLQFRKAVLLLLNLAMGIGLIKRKLEFVLTGFGITPDASGNAQMRFFLSGPPFSRKASLAPGKYTPPPYNNQTLYWLGVIVGILLISQQARVMNVGVERGGALGFDIVTFRFRALPAYLQKLFLSSAKKTD